LSLSSSAFAYNVPAPTTDALLAELPALGIPEKYYQDPYFSNPKDVPKHSREWGGNLFTLGKTGERSSVGGLPEWETGGENNCADWKKWKPREDAIVVMDSDEDEFLKEARRKERLDYKAIQKELMKAAAARGVTENPKTQQKLDGKGTSGWEYVHVRASLRGPMIGGGGPPSRRKIENWLNDRGHQESMWDRRSRLGMQSQVNVI
jgi:hypothetical protein